MAVTYEELQLYRERCAKWYEFEKRLEAIDRADMPGEIFFDADAIRQGLKKKQVRHNELKPKFQKNLFSFS